MNIRRYIKKSGVNPGNNQGVVAQNRSWNPGDQELPPKTPDNSALISWLIL
jgi:hypothetical protein